MASPSEESLTSTKSKRSRLGKIFGRRNSSSTSVAAPASPDARDSTSAKADSSSTKAKRTPMDKLLRRSSTSSLASVGTTVDVQPRVESPEPARGTRQRSDSASSSLSAVAAVAEVSPEGSSPKPKAKGPGAALRRSLSALSITRPRHRRSASEPLVVDTRSASPPPAVPSDSLHKMLSPVEESPVVNVRGSILAVQVPSAEPAAAPEVLSASGVLVERPVEEGSEPSRSEVVSETGAVVSSDVSPPTPTTQLEKAEGSLPPEVDAQAAVVEPDVPSELEVAPEPVTADIVRPPSSTGSAWTEAEAPSVDAEIKDEPSVDNGAHTAESELPAPAPSVPAPLDEEPIVADIITPLSPTDSTRADAGALSSNIDVPPASEGLHSVDSQSTIAEPGAFSTPPEEYPAPAANDIARTPSPSPSAWTEADASSNGLEEPPSSTDEAPIVEPRPVAAEPDAAPELVTASTARPVADVVIVSSSSPVAPPQAEADEPSDVVERLSSPAADTQSVDTWSDVSSVSSIHFAAPNAASAGRPGVTAPSRAEQVPPEDHPLAGPSEPEYAHLGWDMHLPGADGSTYFTHRAYQVVSNIDLRSNETLYQVSEVLAGLGVPPPAGWELWLRVEDGRAPACSFVNHDMRLVAAEPIPALSSIADREKYWTYVEKHPSHCAHTVLSEQNINQAKGALSWDRMDWPLTPSGGRVEPPLFTEAERIRFSAPLNALSGRPSSYEMIIATRDVAEIMQRLCRWEANIPKPAAAGRANESSRSDRRPRRFPRTARAMPGSGPGSSPLWIVAAGVAVGVGFALIGGGMSRRSR